VSKVVRSVEQSGCRAQSCPFNISAQVTNCMHVFTCVRHAARTGKSLSVMLMRYLLLLLQSFNNMGRSYRPNSSFKADGYAAA
jgi:hypothetical protein